jgi:hypothetical protein
MKHPYKGQPLNTFKKSNQCFTSEIIVALAIKNMTPCCLVDIYQSFRGNNYIPEDGNVDNVANAVTIKSFVFW